MSRKSNGALSAGLALGIAACATSTTRVESPEGPPKPIVVSGSQVKTGTQLTAQLEQPIGKDTKQGTRYTARVAQAVVDPSGQPIIPEGSELMGRVANVQPGSGDQPATVALTVESLLVRGVQHPINGSIVATDVKASTSGVKGKYVAGGAAGGGILGAIVGGWRGAVIGGLIGAGTATAISLGLAGREAKLPQGTAIVVKLDSPISVASLRGPRTGMRAP